MYERPLKQKELAKLLGIGEPKLSQIMSRKRKPDVAFLKAAHKRLGVLIPSSCSAAAAIGSLKGANVCVAERREGPSRAFIPHPTNS